MKQNDESPPSNCTKGQLCLYKDLYYKPAPQYCYPARNQPTVSIPRYGSVFNNTDRVAWLYESPEYEGEAQVILKPGTGKAIAGYNLGSIFFV